MWSRPRDQSGARRAGSSCLALAFGWMLTLSPPMALAADAKVDAAEAAAAMERARRQAANPMRGILEASKVRRRVGAGPETALPPAATGVEPGRVDAAAELRPAIPAVQRQPALRTLSVASLNDTASAEVPALTATDRSSPVPGLSLQNLPVTPAPGQAAPQLIEMVEPLLPPRILLDGVGRGPGRHRRPDHPARRHRGPGDAAAAGLPAAGARHDHGAGAVALCPLGRRTGAPRASAAERPPIAARPRAAGNA